MKNKETHPQKPSANPAQRGCAVATGSVCVGSLAKSLRNMACFYGQHPMPGTVTPSDAVGIALADMAQAVEHAAKGEYWHSRNNWQAYSQNIRRSDTPYALSVSRWLAFRFSL